MQIGVQANGRILAGGAFTTVAPNGGTALTRNAFYYQVSVGPNRDRPTQKRAPGTVGNLLIV